MSDRLYGVDRARTAKATALQIKSHSAKSLEYLSRPSSAASRPRSASSRPPSRQQTQPIRPKSADSRFFSHNTLRRGVPVAQKTPLQRAIDGDTGPPMLGISGMAVTALERAYREEFEGVIAAACDHPYVATTAWNRGSAPHNLITGMLPGRPSVAVVALPPSGILC